jgi:DNA-binding CsgD family transcriptional regulator
MLGSHGNPCPGPDADVIPHPDRLDRSRAQRPPRRERQGQQRQQRRDAEDRRERGGQDVGTEAARQGMGEWVSDGDRFAEAVRRVAEGGSALDPEVVSHMLGRRRVKGPLEELTPREHEVLRLMAEGRSNHAIADALVISGRAVEKHVTSIFTKLNLPPAPEDHRRVLAVLAFLRS